MSKNCNYSISLGSMKNGVPLDMIQHESLQGHLDIIQLCPQNKGFITKELISDIQTCKPESEIRLHANVSLMNIKDFRKQTKYPMCHVDAGTYQKEDFKFYFDMLIDILSFNKNPYSIHAGNRRRCTLTRMINNIKDIQQRSGVKVGVEGLYPTQLYLKNKTQGYLMSNLNEYLKVMDSGICYAIDLSHMNIIKNQLPDEFDINIVEDLICHENCMEIHISDNNGSADTHEPICLNTWWNDMIKKASAPIISEERLDIH